MCRSVPEHSLDEIRGRQPISYDILINHAVADVLVYPNRWLEPLVGSLVLCCAVVRMLFGEIFNACAVCPKKADSFVVSVVVAVAILPITTMFGANKHVSVASRVVALDSNRLGARDYSVAELLPQPRDHVGFEHVIPVGRRHKGSSEVCLLAFPEQVVVIIVGVVEADHDVYIAVPIDIGVIAVGPLQEDRERIGIVR